MALREESFTPRQTGGMGQYGEGATAVISVLKRLLGQFESTFGFCQAKLLMLIHPETPFSGFFRLLFYVGIPSAVSFFGWNFFIQTGSNPYLGSFWLFFITWYLIFYLRVGKVCLLLPVYVLFCSFFPLVWKMLYFSYVNHVSVLTSVTRLPYPGLLYFPIDAADAFGSKGRGLSWTACLFFFVCWLFFSKIKPFIYEDLTDCVKFRYGVTCPLWVGAWFAAAVEIFCEFFIPLRGIWHAVIYVAAVVGIFFAWTFVSSVLQKVSSLLKRRVALAMSRGASGADDTKKVETQKLITKWRPFRDVFPDDPESSGYESDSDSVFSSDKSEHSSGDGATGKGEKDGDAGVSNAGGSSVQSSGSARPAASAEVQSFVPASRDPVEDHADDDIAGTVQSGPPPDEDVDSEIGEERSIASAVASRPEFYMEPKSGIQGEPVVSAYSNVQEMASDSGEEHSVTDNSSLDFSERLRLVAMSGDRDIVQQLSALAHEVVGFWRNLVASKFSSPDEISARNGFRSIEDETVYRRAFSSVLDLQSVYAGEVFLVAIKNGQDPSVMAAEVSSFTNEDFFSDNGIDDSVRIEFCPEFLLSGSGGSDALEDFSNEEPEGIRGFRGHGNEALRDFRSAAADEESLAFVGRVHDQVRHSDFPTADDGFEIDTPFAREGGHYSDSVVGDGRHSFEGGGADAPSFDGTHFDPAAVPDDEWGDASDTSAAGAWAKIDGQSSVDSAVPSSPIPENFGDSCEVGGTPDDLLFAIRPMERDQVLNFISERRTRFQQINAQALADQIAEQVGSALSGEDASKALCCDLWESVVVQFGMGHRSSITGQVCLDFLFGLLSSFVKSEPSRFSDHSRLLRSFAFVLCGAWRRNLFSKIDLAIEDDGLSRAEIIALVEEVTKWVSELASVPDSGDFGDTLSLGLVTLRGKVGISNVQSPALFSGAYDAGNDSDAAIDLIVGSWEKRLSKPAQAALGVLRNLGKGNHILSEVGSLWCVTNGVSNDRSPLRMVHNDILSLSDRIILTLNEGISDIIASDRSAAEMGHRKIRALLLGDPGEEVIAQLMMRCDRAGLLVGSSAIENSGDQIERLHERVSELSGHLHNLEESIAETPRKKALSVWESVKGDPLGSILRRCAIEEESFREIPEKQRIPVFQEISAPGGVKLPLLVGAGSAVADKVLLFPLPGDLTWAIDDENMAFYGAQQPWTRINIGEMLKGWQDFFSINGISDMKFFILSESLDPQIQEYARAKLIAPDGVTEDMRPSWWTGSVIFPSDLEGSRDMTIKAGGMFFRLKTAS